MPKKKGNVKPKKTTNSIDSNLALTRCNLVTSITQNLLKVYFYADKIDWHEMVERVMNIISNV
ncbi:hypothetical protein BTN33_21160 [Aeromonas veronii]|nr:hypothetical protein BTN33_21160 [Aeromonas veronii]